MGVSSNNLVMPLRTSALYYFIFRRLARRQASITREKMATENALALGNHGEADDEEMPQRLFVSNAREAITFIIVYDAHDLKRNEAQRCFKPDLVFQIFGESEAIYGYRNLNINIYVLANSANCYVELEHCAVAKSTKGPTPDNILQKLSPWLPENFYTNKKEFLHVMLKENHRQMFGKIIDRFNAYNTHDQMTYKYIITQCSGSEPGFTEFHARFESYIVWYIDAASHVDPNEANWVFLYVYERRKNPNGKRYGYYPVGYLSIYKFFHFPDKIRIRIAQVFVLPCCQRSGVGMKLLNGAYKMVARLPNVIDIAVEDPCDGFTRMRDVLDCQLLMQLESFKYPKILRGFTKKMLTEANRQFRFNKRQCRRAYEVLRMAYILNRFDNKAYQALYKEMKAYILAPHKREREAIKRKRVVMSRRLCHDEPIVYHPIDDVMDLTKTVDTHFQEIKASANQVAKRMRTK